MPESNNNSKALCMLKNIVRIQVIMYSLAESNVVYPDTGRYNCNIKFILRGFQSTEDLYYVSHMHVVILIKN